jgi:hypothetical protein
MMFLRKHYRDLDKLHALQRKARDAPLSDEEKIELRKLTRVENYVKFQVIFWTGMTAAIFMLVCVGMMVNFAPLVHVPGARTERVTSGAILDSLVNVVNRCAPTSGVPSLFAPKSATSQFLAAAAGDRMGVTNGKIAIAESFALGISSTARGAILAHELGHVLGMEDETDADIFAARCMGEEAILEGFAETERYIAGEEMAKQLEREGNNPEQITEIQSVYKINMSLRRDAYQLRRK